MEDKLSLYLKYRDRIRKLQILAGLLPNNNLNIAYRLMPYINATIILAMSIAIFEFSYIHVSNLYIFFGAFSLGVSLTTNSQKLICFICYRKRLADLHKDLAELYDKDLQNDEMRPIVVSPVLMYYRISFNQTILIILTTGGFLFKPIILLIVQLAKGVENMKYIVPLPITFPWLKPGNNLLYWIHYAISAYTTVVILISSATIDTLFGYYIFQMAGQLRSLSYQIMKLNSKEDNRKVINECVAKYTILIKCRENLECIYGPILLYLLVMSSVLFCGLLYQVAHHPKDSLPIIVFIVMKLLQIFSYGAFGTSLVTENDSYREAIYMSDWAGSGDKPLMSNILTMILCNKPFRLRACFVTGISVEMFLTFLNTAASYYLMIRTIEEKRSV